MQRPEAAVDFDAKLAGQPDHQARKIARIIRRLFDDAVDQLRPISELQPHAEQHASSARRLDPRQKRDNHSGGDGSAEVDPIMH